jgi:hypothetical protein
VQQEEADELLQEPGTEFGAHADLVIARTGTPNIGQMVDAKTVLDRGRALFSLLPFDCSLDAI